MRILALFFVIAIAATAGLWMPPHSLFNAVVAGVVACLLFEVLRLRQRISRLERAHSLVRPETAPIDQTPTEPASSPQDADELPLALPPDSSTRPPVAPRPKHVPDASRAPHPLQKLAASLLRFFTSGNPVLKIGLVVVFFGVAFLLNYAAHRNLLPLELRLAGVALAGLTMLAIGWRLRRTHPLYGLGLEGGGIGILYLVLFAAAKLSHLLPMPLALGVMIGLVVFSGLLAVLQDAKGLAVIGSIGGFLAPVLMSTGSGNHVILLSYYALLNSGLLGIAWFKAWRELNLVGFVFTFGLVFLWGASAYTPAKFASTEPFLILFFLMYCLISVLFALRQPLRLRGFIDGPLVFGLPIVAGSLQAALVHDVRYGMAWSALVLGLWYIGLARLLWNRFNDDMRLLTEAFLALGVVFASLAIPLGLDSHWTTAAWALEGAAMIWIGVRQDRPAARIFGLMVQAGAAAAFFDHTALPPGSLLFANRVFLGYALIGGAALFSGYWLDRIGDKARRWESPLPLLLLAWGLIWWYVGGWVDLRHHGQMLHLHPEPAFLLYVCASSAAFAWLTRLCSWPRLRLALLLLLPMMILVYGAQMADSGPLLIHSGWVAWPLAFCLHACVLHRFEQQWPKRILVLSHCLGLWLLLLALTTELAWRVDHLPGLTGTWSSAVWGLVPTMLLALLAFQGHRLDWPVVRHAHIYHGPAADVPLLALLLWCLGSFGLSGNPAPLPYLPLLNPLELIELAILLLAARRWLHGPTVRPPEKKAKGQQRLLALLSFAWLNVVTARTVHFSTGIGYSFSVLFASPIFQAALAALWALLALSLTIWGAKRLQRPIWFAGASLLALVVLKLFVIDLSGTGSISRIISFLVVGLLMLVIGYFAPLPPQSNNESAHAPR